LGSLTYRFCPWETLYGRFSGDLPPPLETSHILSIFCSFLIFYYFLRSAIGDASTRNMSSSADISFFINIYELQNFQRQRFSKQLFLHEILIILARFSWNFECRRPEEIFKFGVSEIPFPGLWGSFDRILMVKKQRFSLSKFIICLQFSSTKCQNGRRRI
jgi:hypothetical protein